MVFGMNLPNSVEGSSALKKTSDLLETLRKELSINREIPTKLDEVPSVKVEISINGAKELPCRRKKKSKYQKMKNKHSSKREDNVMPSTYVIFESMAGEALCMTSVCPKSSSPQWNYRCVVDLPLDLFTRDNKQLIFKVWNKCTNTVLQPNIQTDLILGFCAVDVSVLIDGSPNVQGWFNIVDFCGKPNGQINLSISPLENVQKYKYYCLYKNSTVTGRTTVNSTPLSTTSSNMTENSSELFSKTLKRKFSELDEITERLRARLSEVVQEDSDDLNDVLMDQFERDINNSEVDDLNLLNFDQEAIKFSNKISDVKNNLNDSDYDSKMYRIGEENDPKYCKVDAKDSGARKIKNTDLNMDSEKIASNELLAKDFFKFLLICTEDKNLKAV
ncbi:C2 domain-containing protein 3-like isoform X3 [Sitophilus oryzae]|uniref:C2 domain-containing protein 3-like isoform X3 n=1 Tax=Sitophilus oryzae TaxID=7048 RepID=A0A6J2YYB2_SITOR|nr:C2 domain-containing protein 3-like isoform X3 [Sitophilus oryzae]